MHKAYASLSDRAKAALSRDMWHAASRGTCAGGARALQFGFWLAMALNRGDGGARGVAIAVSSACA
jgi:hypothetical protein